MFYRKRVFPSMSMLLAFDAAARSGKFSDAARELNMTQAAVSRQIAALENQLDVRLFHRVKKSVGLTDIGKAYSQEIHEALKMVRSATLNAMTSPLNGVLNLGILPTFGTRWLMPRFPDFLSENPEITVNFVSKLVPFDFAVENLHCAIHYGTPDWPGTQSAFLMKEEAIPVCSPGLLHEETDTPLDLLTELPLLHLESRPDAWNDWLADNGLPPGSNRGMLFEQISIIIQAAVAGIGVALLPRFLVHNELEQNQLVALSESALRSERGYYLVMPNDQVEYPPVVAFRNWLIKVTATENNSNTSVTV